MKYFASLIFNKSILFIALLISLSARAVDSQLIPVKVQLKWKHQFQFAGYYAAIEKGYYKELGLDVELIEISNENSPLKAIKEGTADFAIVASDVVLLRAEGYPVVILASVFQHSAQILLAPKWSGINHIHNLVGKRVMIENHSADLIAYMNDEGVSLSQLINIPHTYNVQTLMDKKVDVMTAYSTTEPYILEQNNIPYTIISPRSGGIDFYGDVLICTEKILREQPELTLNFREASLKGWNYAMENKPEVIDFIYDKYSKRLNKEHLLYEANKIQDLISPEIIEIGYSNPKRWERIIEIYQQTKMLSNNLSVKGLLYTDYIKKEVKIPWKLISIFTLIILFFGLITLFFYRLATRLKFEISKGERINNELQESKVELQVSNEKLMLLSNFKESMTNMIIHDLKTPLSAIMHIDLFPDDKNRIEIVKQSGYRMFNLVQNILDVYKYENSEFHLDKKEYPLIDIIDKAFDEIDFVANQKSIRFEKGNDIKCIVNVDEEIIRRVFANILSNAVKFSPKSGIIRIYTTIDKNNTTRVYISNQGPRIPKDRHKSIFEKFGQVDKMDQGRLTSTGLGLTFSKMAIEAHGGEIGVISEEGKDVEFWFALPGSVCMNCSKCKVYNFLTELEKDYLLPFVTKLLDYNVIETEKINSIISSIDKSNISISDWVDDLEKMVTLGDNIGYLKLLNL